MIDLKKLSSALEYCMLPMPICSQCPYGKSLENLPDTIEDCPAMPEVITALMMYAAGLSREEAQGEFGQQTLEVVRESLDAMRLEAIKGVKIRGANE